MPICTYRRLYVFNMLVKSDKTSISLLLLTTHTLYVYSQHIQLCILILLFRAGEENRANQATWGRQTFKDMERIGNDGCCLDDVTVFVDWYV